MRRTLPRRKESEPDMAVETAATPPPSVQGAAGEFGKRVLDVSVALVLLALALPVMAVIGALIRLDSRGTAFFRQERVGVRGTRFFLLKFRTMRTGTPTLPTDEMTRLPSPVTRVGAFLRRFSLDELPQLINVLKGEMSLVGPRPALPMQTDLNARRAAAGVDALLPGITGWAQINGRDELDTESKVAHDIWYLQHRSLLLDLIILVRTVTSVFSGRGSR